MKNFTVTYKSQSMRAALPYGSRDTYFEKDGFVAFNVIIEEQLIKAELEAIDEAAVRKAYMEKEYDCYGAKLKNYYDLTIGHVTEGRASVFEVLDKSYCRLRTMPLGQAHMIMSTEDLYVHPIFPLDQEQNKIKWEDRHTFF